MRADRFVNGLKVNYLSEAGNTYEANHGGTGGRASIVDVYSPERIVAVTGRSGDLIDQLSFVIRSPTGLRIAGPFGGGGGMPFAVKGHIIAFHGSTDGTYLNSLGFYIGIKYVGEFGGLGGQYFEHPTALPGEVEIQRILVRYGAYVDGITTDYVRADGIRYSIHNGGTGGHSLGIVDLARHERITGAVGRAGGFLDSISFLTEMENGIRKTHGPFGGGGGNCTYLVNADILGFYGRSGGLIDQIGFLTL